MKVKQTNGCFPIIACFLKFACFCTEVLPARIPAPSPVRQQFSRLVRWPSVCRERDISFRWPSVACIVFRAILMPLRAVKRIILCVPFKENPSRKE